MAKAGASSNAGSYATFAATPDSITGNDWITGVQNLFQRSHGGNVVWQDTTSNATYCSASQALSTSG